MGEVQPTTRFSAELSEETFLKVWHDIGESALGKRVTVSISDRTETPPNPGVLPIAHESITYPDFVTWVDDEESGQKLAVITEEGLELLPLEITDKFDMTIPLRATRAVFRATYSKGKHSNTSEFVHDEPNIAKRGLIVEALPTLWDRLESGDLKVNRLGKDSKAFIGELVDLIQVQ